MVKNEQKDKVPRFTVSYIEFMHRIVGYSHTMILPVVFGYWTDARKTRQVSWLGIEQPVGSSPTWPVGMVTWWTTSPETSNGTPHSPPNDPTWACCCWCNGCASRVHWLGILSKHGFIMTMLLRMPCSIMMFIHFLDL